jgi:molecular chaperone HtpG
LQADAAVKKNIELHHRKVADKLKSFTESREDFEQKMERYQNRFRSTECYLKINSTRKQVLCFIPNDDKYFTLEELKENLAANQTDKDGKLVALYAGNKEAQHSYIETAKKRLQVLLLDSPIISHLIQKNRRR